MDREHTEFCLSPETRLCAFTLGFHLSEASAERGGGSVKTCSMNGPEGADLSSAGPDVDSGTSVASVASSADWAGRILLLVGGATGAKAQHIIPS